MFYLDVQFKSTLDFASHIELPCSICFGTSISATLTHAFQGLARLTSYLVQACPAIDSDWHYH